MTVGNPRCEYCHGRGYIRARGIWRKCQCVTGTQAARDAMRRLNSIGTEYRSVRDRVADKDRRAK